MKKTTKSKKQETLKRIGSLIKEGVLEDGLNKASYLQLEAIAIGIKYLVEKSK